MGFSGGRYIFTIAMGGDIKHVNANLGRKEKWDLRGLPGKFWTFQLENVNIKAPLVQLLRKLNRLEKSLITLRSLYFMKLIFKWWICLCTVLGLFTLKLKFNFLKTFSNKDYCPNKIMEVEIFAQKLILYWSINIKYFWYSFVIVFNQKKV